VTDEYRGLKRTGLHFDSFFKVMSAIGYIAVLNKMRYTPLATDALCPMPYVLCPREHLMLLRKAIGSVIAGLTVVGENTQNINSVRSPISV
jgi:hypothetical protein